MKNKITIADLEKSGSCYSYEELQRIYGKRKYLTPMQICNMRSIPYKDRIWVLLHTEIIPDKELRLLACDFAERALVRVRENGIEPPKASWDAISVSRRFAVGEATAEELEEASWAACRAAHWAADCAADWAANSAAHWAARRAAHWAADCAAEREAQLTLIRKTLKELGYE